MVSEKKYSYLVVSLLLAACLALGGGLVWYLYPEAETQKQVAPDQWQEQFYQGEIKLGKDNAPIEITYLFSLTCSACIRFHHTVMPELVKKLVDRGLVQITWVGFPTDDTAATVELIARLTGNKEDYASVVNYAYSDMPDKRSAGSFIKSVTRWGKKIKALDDTDLAYLKRVGKQAREYLLNKRSKLAEKYQNSGVPALIINGKLYDGEMSYSAITAFISKELKI